MADVPGPEHDELVYESAGLPKTTNWWGAFVIGLAGTILVTGIAPVMVTELGAASVPVIVVITITGYIVCLLLAELSAGGVDLALSGFASSDLDRILASLQPPKDPDDAPSLPVGATARSR